jgi:transposase
MPRRSAPRQNAAPLPPMASPVSFRRTPKAATTSSTTHLVRRGLTAALCWAHARRQFFELADIAANARRGKKAAAISPIALEAVKRIDALFDIERGTTAKAPNSFYGFARNRARLSSPRWKHGCVSNVPASQAPLRLPNRSTTCFAAGIGLPSLSRTVVSASPTTRRSAPCADLRWAENHGSSPAPIAPPSWPR